MRETFTCPHCGETVQPLGVAMHLIGCLHRPGVIPLVRELMDPDNTGYGVGLKAYRRISKAYNHAAPPDALRAPSSDTLARKCGSWGGVMALLGLRQREQERRTRYTARAEQQAAENAAIAEVAEAIQRQRAERLIERGLEVCRVREIDGGRRVACMLR